MKTNKDMKRYFVLVLFATGVSTAGQIVKTPIVKNNSPLKNAKAVNSVLRSKVRDSVIISELNLKETEPKKYEILAKKILAEKGWINNRNSEIVRGIEGFVKGVYVGNGKIFILLKIVNRTNINYDIENASFITSPVQNDKRQLEAEEKIFIPLFSNKLEIIPKKASEKLVFVFDKFNISDNKTLLFIMNEKDGERTLTLEIKPKYIIEAEYIK